MLNVKKIYYSPWEGINDFRSYGRWIVETHHYDKSENI